VRESNGDNDGDGDGCEQKYAEDGGQHEREAVVLQWCNSGVTVV
jgi:hypothetical protein